MRPVVFVRDNTNRHSIRVLAAAFEKWFPARKYSIVSPNDVVRESPKNSLALFSFASGASKKYYELAGLIRKLRPDINTACGGPHPTARSREALGFFDAVCTGEGEITIADIIRGGDCGILKGPIEGHRVENLDEFPSFPRKNILLGPIEITRGCLSSCAYCQTPQIFRGPIRSRSAKAVRAEIEFAASLKDRIDARFISPDASSYMYKGGTNAEAIESLLKNARDAVGKEGRVFFGTFPSELDPVGINAEVVELLCRYCDNKLIVLGLQSASERMKKVMTRRSGLEDTERAIRMLKGKGFEIIIDLIFGLPYEDEESYNKTYEFIERWRGETTVHAHPFDNLPGSRWEREKPTPVPEKLSRAVASLEGIGKVFGRINKDQTAEREIDICRL